MQPDYFRADRLLLPAGEEFALLWVLMVPGAWGKDAPEAPSFVWSDPQGEDT